MPALFDKFPPPGQMIRVNNHNLHACLDSRDGPTVILESGQAGFSLDWMLVQPEVARFARVCSYDRAGLGWSDAGPKPRTPKQVVAELHAMLTAANIPAPYIFAAHSLGGRYARLFAHQYPDEVIGMVLLDAYHEAFDSDLGTEKSRIYMQNRVRQFRFFGALARLGVAQLLGGNIVGLLGADFRAMPMQERKRYALLVARPGAMEMTIDEYVHAVAANADFQNYTLRADMPLHVLTHGIPWPYPDYEHVWQDAQCRAAAWTTRSKLIVADKSGHNIMLGQPELVISSIKEVIAEA